MRTLIFEDEKHTAIRLKSLLIEIDNSIEIIDIISSVEEGLKWFSKNDMPDLIFQDIILTDGNCFDIFEKVKISAPIIFTTAFSNYAIRSFQVNSIDYIVKPYDINDIRSALKKLKNLKNSFIIPEQKLLKEIISKKEFTPKKRFLVKVGDNFSTINSRDIAYLISDDSITFVTLFNKMKYIVDYSILDLSKQMDTSEFFQINRKMIINITSVSKIHTWFNSRLRLELSPSSPSEVIVSRERVSRFKSWLDK